MGWAERMAGQARAVAEAQGKALAELPFQPEVEALGAGASPWHEAMIRQMLSGQLQHVNELRQFMARPRLIGPGGQPSGPDPAMVILDSLSRLHQSQALLTDLVLGFLTGRAELRPAGGAPKTEPAGSENGKKGEAPAE